eukprot:2141595-Prymnesium_polylepis.1
MVSSPKAESAGLAHHVPKYWACCELEVHRYPDTVFILRVVTTSLYIVHTGLPLRGDAVDLGRLLRGCLVESEHFRPF